MLIKAGVDISRLSRDIRRGVGVVAVYLLEKGTELVVTSTYEGNHGAGSLHYSNDAFDFRTPSWFGKIEGEKLSGKLGSGYEVVVESDHIHVEWDPKKLV
jgi:hypothetical protein